ncbi:uncharacterized protein N7484_005409 [Penicillium longicatenatum]|uniref:uncharacterized protein n=1 Tax=Penicillium longicatenatum TaxID=1561947 RepID=UPI002549BBC6|nr:uncharacterized protein N7484_005409 [Penicillium longicatenatum]KAJ5642902.1 hypothetical protein N7484_005409 [Penicillium longicatenatum]
MPLVQYSDSESESDEADVLTPSAKRPCHKQPTSDKTSSSLPPLPATFHDLYASATRVSTQDDPSLHGGRKRVIPHVEGNWPTHLYLELYPSKEELVLLGNLIPQSSTSQPGVQSLLHSDLGAQLPLHISLSRPVVLRTEQRSSFEISLKKEIEESQIAPFALKPNGLKWVSNYERTRWFLVLRVGKPGPDSLNGLLRLSNRVLARFGQPPLYASHGNQHNQDFSDYFHISLAWALKEPCQEEKDRVAATDLKPLQDLWVRRARVALKPPFTISLENDDADPNSHLDLQAFQAQHFPGHETLGAPANEPEYDEDAGGDEDLGYYPDGVKRTLTDDQIRIFRHSEIHSLLRARQLEQDDAEYEARQELSAKDHQAVAEKSQEDGLASKAIKSNEHTNKEANVPAAKKSKRSAEHDLNSTMSDPLNYEKLPGSSGQRQQSRNQHPYPGRRIISYDD